MGNGPTLSSASPKRADEVFGDDWQKLLDHIKGPINRPSTVEMDGATFENIEYVPIRVSNDSLVTDTTNQRYEKTYILQPKFVKQDPKQSVLDKLPEGGATYYQESVRDIDDEESIWYKLFYPLSNSMHPSMELILGTHTNLASSDTSDYIEEHGDASNTLTQKISKVGGYVSNFNYGIGESNAMQQRFGSPTDSIEYFIDSTIDDMTAELLSTSVQYGYTFRKIYEGDLLMSQASHSIFGEEEDQNVIVDTTAGIRVEDLVHEQSSFIEKVSAALGVSPDPGDSDEVEY